MVGLLLINLGTPDAPTPAAVRRYLREFLSDPRVLDINSVGRALLLNAVILPFRPAKSAAAYREIWHPETGSPLLQHSREFALALQAELHGDVHVELAMRYGSPSIAAALDRFSAMAIDRILVLPLFPHYASSSTGTAVARVWELAGARWNTPRIEVLPPFYDDPAFIAAFAQIISETLAASQPDYVLFSYHGLPERHVKKSDESGGSFCLQQTTCCDSIVEANRHCYRAQCYATTRALAASLGLAADRHSVSFQSRLGRDPWIRPFTDEVLPKLAAEGKRHIAVVCPAFVADCLETLEEIAIRARDDWRRAGGTELTLVPSLNARASWVAAVAGWTRRHLAGLGGATTPRPAGSTSLST